MLEFKKEIANKWVFNFTFKYHDTLFTKDGINLFEYIIFTDIAGKRHVAFMPIAYIYEVYNKFKRGKIYYISIERNSEKVEHGVGGVHNVNNLGKIRRVSKFTSIDDIIGTTTGNVISISGKKYIEIQYLPSGFLAYNLNSNFYDLVKKKYPFKDFFKQKVFYNGNVYNLKNEYELTPDGIKLKSIYDNHLIYKTMNGNVILKGGIPKNVWVKDSDVLLLSDKEYENRLLNSDLTAEEYYNKLHSNFKPKTIAPPKNRFGMIILPLLVNLIKDL